MLVYWRIYLLVIYVAWNAIRITCPENYRAHSSCMHVGDDNLCTPDCYGWVVQATTDMKMCDISRPQPPWIPLKIPSCMDPRSDRSENCWLKASPVPSSSVFKTCWAHPTTREHNVSLFNGANWVPKSGSVTGGTNRWLQKVRTYWCLCVGSEERSMISRYNPLWSIFYKVGPKTIVK